MRGTPDFLKVLVDSRRQGRQGRLVAQARAGVGRGVAGVAARRAGRRAASRRCSATRSPRLGVIAYESEAARRADRQRARDRRDRAARHRRPGRRRRGRRSGGDVVPRRLSDDPAGDRRSVGRAARPLAVRAHQSAHEGLDGPRRPDHQDQGHVRASRPGGGDRPPPSRDCASASRRPARQRAGRDDADGRERSARPVLSPPPSPTACRPSPSCAAGVARRRPAACPTTAR